MKTGKFLVSVFGAFLVSNLLTTLWYMAMDDANYVPYRREEINYAALLVNHLIYALLVVYLFPYYYEKHRTRLGAFGYGVIAAALMFIPQALVVRAIWKVDINTIFLLNSIAHLAIGGVMGVVVALIYDFKKSKTT